MPGFTFEALDQTEVGQHWGWFLVLGYLLGYHRHPGPGLQYIGYPFLHALPGLDHDLCRHR